MRRNAGDYVKSWGAALIRGAASNPEFTVLQVLVIKYKYKYFEFSPIKYSSTSSTDTPSTSVNIGWLICTGNTRAVFPGR